MERQVRAISSGNTQAFARATAVAFRNGGSQADAYAEAISSGIREHGCGFYTQVFSQVCFPGSIYTNFPLSPSVWQHGL